ncbi:MAG: SRPBCC domain-containing protein [Ardenticatenaceae bacterium]
MFSGPREMVYKSLQEPDTLAEAMPCTTTLKRVAEDVYHAKMAIRMGFMKSSFTGTVSIKEKQPPEHFKLIVEGQGGDGLIKGEGKIHLEAQDGGKTLIRYTGEAQMEGGFARGTQRLMQSMARKMINSGLKSLEKRLAKQRAKRKNYR